MTTFGKVADLLTTALVVLSCCRIRPPLRMNPYGGSIIKHLNVMIDLLQSILMHGFPSAKKVASPRCPAALRCRPRRQGSFYSAHGDPPHGTCLPHHRHHACRRRRRRRRQLTSGGWRRARASCGGRARRGRGGAARRRRAAARAAADGVSVTCGGTWRRRTWCGAQGAPASRQHRASIASIAQPRPRIKTESASE